MKSMYIFAALFQVLLIPWFSKSTLFTFSFGWTLVSVKNYILSYKNNCMQSNNHLGRGFQNVYIDIDRGI